MRGGQVNRVVVVGAGLAGLRACQGLRQRGYAGALTLVGDEPYPPYDRPPLSKQYLAGEWPHERVLLETDERLVALGIELRLGPQHRATALDLAGRALGLDSGEELPFDGLVLATGARARSLAAFEGLRGSHLLRSLDDAAALRSELATGGRRLLVVGGGFIGMEVAATSRRLGAEVTVVEPLEAPLARVLGAEIGAAARLLHERHGVRFLLGTGVAAAAERPGGGLRAELTDNTMLEADLALVGVGAAPNVEWLEGSGLDVGPAGVACDACLRAGPGVVAVGDLALWKMADGRQVRLEHRTNAAEQGDHAAAVLLGSTAAFETVPYVWSDQYEVKIQVLGLPEPDDECRIVAGSPGEGRFAAVYGRAGVVSGAVGFSMPRQVMRLRPLIASGAPYDEALELLG
jgi:NADPH-dependent 2,4-dienoyl-CoA reductase/sulfur reductase-like enzyme